ncbi:MAG: tetratricopeptide repeat protein [Candidatus Kapaibacterium sp.]
MMTTDTAVNPHDTVKELNEQAMTAVSDGAYEHALELGYRAAELATLYSYPLEKGRALWNVGWAYSNLLRYDDALAVLLQAADIFEEAGDAFGISRVLQGIGNVYFTTGRLLESLEEYLNAYAVLELAGLERNSLALLGNIAYTYKLLGEYHYAIEYAEKQLNMATHYMFDFHIAKALNSLGSSYFHLGDYATSLTYYSEGLLRATEKNDTDAKSWILGNIASVYLQLENYTGALDSMMQSIALSEQNKDQRHLAYCYNQICSIYRKMNNDSLALDYAMRSLGIYTTLSDRVGEANVLMNIARIFDHNGDAGIALDYAQKSHRLHCESATKEGEAESLLLIASAHEKTDHPILALEAAEQALAIAQSINSHALLQSALRHLHRLALLIHDHERTEDYAKQLEAASTIIDKEHQRMTAQKLMLESQLQKTRSQAEKLLTTLKHPLSDDFLHKTSTITQQGFVLAHGTLTEPPKERRHKRPITVHTFGHFAVTINGHELGSEDWQRKKARDIFKILLINHRQSVSADELIDTLWSETAGRNLIPTLWNCVTYIRKALEPKLKPREPSAYIKIAGKNYLLDLGSDADIDFLTFKDLIARGRKQAKLSETIQLYEQAVALYHGDFLKEDAFEEWASYERESMKENFLHATIEIGNFHADNGNVLDAVMCARRAIEVDRVYEDAYELLFTVLADNNQTSELSKAWRSCQLSYKKELGSTPPFFLAELAAR